MTTIRSTRSEIYRHLRELRREMLSDAARDWRSEIVDGGIVMMMSPVPRHGLTARDITRQLDRQLPEPLVAIENIDVDDESLATLRMPDIAVAPRSAFDTDADAADPREIILAIEVVSRSNPENDYVRKMSDYAAMGIDDYLIVDPRDGTCLHATEVGSKGAGPEYLVRTAYTYGDTIDIAGVRIDTTGLPRYGRESR